MERPRRKSLYMDMDASCELLRPQPSMYSPLLEPYCLECSGCNLGNQRENVGATEGAKAILVHRVCVWITRIEWDRKAQHYEAGIQIGLIERIEMDIGGKIAEIADQKAIGLKLIAGVIRPVLRG